MTATITSERLLSTDVRVLADMPLERLEAEISTFAGRLASATAIWLCWIAAYDRREGWRELRSNSEEAEGFPVAKPSRARIG